MTEHSHIPVITAVLSSNMAVHVISLMSVRPLQAFSCARVTLLNISKRISEAKRPILLFLKPSSDEPVAIWENYKNTKATVEIDYGIILGDCCDCTDQTQHRAWKTKRGAFL